MVSGLGPLGHDGGGLINGISGLPGAEEAQVPHFYHVRTQRKDRCLGTRKWALPTNQTCQHLHLELPNLHNCDKHIAIVYQPLSLWHCSSKPKGLRRRDSRSRTHRMWTNVPHWVCLHIHLEFNNQDLYALRSAFILNWEITILPPWVGFLLLLLLIHATAPFPLLFLVLKTKSPRRFQNVILKFKAE